MLPVQCRVKGKQSQWSSAGTDCVFETVSVSSLQGSSLPGPPPRQLHHHRLANEPLKCVSAFLLSYSSCFPGCHSYSLPVSCLSAFPMPLLRDSLSFFDSPLSHSPSKPLARSLCRHWVIWGGWVRGMDCIGKAAEDEPGVRPGQRPFLGFCFSWTCSLCPGFAW